MVQYGLFYSNTSLNIRFTCVCILCVISSPSSFFEVLLSKDVTSWRAEDHHMFLHIQLCSTKDDLRMNCRETRQGRLNMFLNVQANYFFFMNKNESSDIAAELWFFYLYCQEFYSFLEYAHLTQKIYQVGIYSCIQHPVRHCCY